MPKPVVVSGKEMLETAAERVRGAGHAASESIADAGSRIADRVKHGADAAAEQASSIAHDLADRAGERGAAALHTSQDIAGQKISDLQLFVQRNPLGALLAAAGVGLVLGLMARR